MGGRFLIGVVLFLGTLRVGAEGGSYLPYSEPSSSEPIPQPISPPSISGPREPDSSFDDSVSPISVEHPAISSSTQSEAESSFGVFQEVDSGKEAEEENRLMKIRGNKIYIICFYAPRKRGDRLVPVTCQNLLVSCRKRYGKDHCVRVNNPTEERLRRIRNAGVAIVVTHSVPSEVEECGFDMWYTDLSPVDIAELLEGVPILWFGCFGKSISHLASNIIPLGWEGGFLHLDKKTLCRFKATMLCLEEFSSQNSSFTQKEIEACSRKRVKQIPDCFLY